jgi:DNA modification methylase
MSHLRDLTPDKRNARKHNPRNVGMISRSLQETGFGRSILLAKDGTVLAGNATIEAAAEVGMEDVIIVQSDGTKVIAVQRTDLEPGSEMATKISLADNRAAELAEWDTDILAGLQDDIDLTQFIFDDELDAQLADLHGGTEGLTDPDDVPDPPAEPVTQPGDLWLLGDHRILCGDSTKAEDVIRLMNGERSRLMPTDPPYLVDYQGGNHPQSWHNKAEVKDKHWDDYREGDGPEFFSAFLRVALEHALTDRPAIYQWHATRRQVLVEEAWKQNGLLVHQTIIWFKARPVLTRSHYMWQHEPCFYGWIEGRIPELKPPADAKTVWEINQQGESDGIHPTQKPVELVKRPIEYHTRPGDLIYEPFSGSGTAIIAAEQTGRRCYAMELAPEFVDVTITRWEQFTGATAVRETAAMAAD